VGWASFERGRAHCWDGASMLFGFGEGKGHTNLAHPRPGAVGETQEDNPRPLPSSNTHLPDGLTVAVTAIDQRSSSGYRLSSPIERQGIRRRLRTPAGRVFRLSRCDAACWSLRRPGLPWPRCSFSTPWPAWAWPLAAGQCGHCARRHIQDSGAAEVIDHGVLLLVG